MFLFHDLVLITGEEESGPSQFPRPSQKVWIIENTNIPSSLLRALCHMWRTSATKKGPCDSPEPEKMQEFDWFFAFES